MMRVIASWSSGVWCLIRWADCTAITICFQSLRWLVNFGKTNTAWHFFIIIWSHWVWLFEIMFQVLVLNWHFHFYRDLIWLIMFVLAFSLTLFVQPLFLCPNKNSSIWPNSVCPSMWQKTALASAQDIWPCNARHAEYKGKGWVQYEEENTIADWGWSWSILQSQTLSWEKFSTASTKSIEGTDETSHTAPRLS